jgi:hypothetical protein
LVDAKTWAQDYPKFRPFLSSVVKSLSNSGAVHEIDKTILYGTKDWTAFRVLGRLLR